MVHARCPFGKMCPAKFNRPNVRRSNVCPSNVRVCGMCKPNVHHGRHSDHHQHNNSWISILRLHSPPSITIFQNARVDIVNMLVIELVVHKSVVRVINYESCLWDISTTGHIVHWNYFINLINAKTFIEFFFFTAVKLLNVRTEDLYLMLLVCINVWLSLVCVCVYLSVPASAPGILEITCAKSLSRTPSTPTAPLSISCLWALEVRVCASVRDPTAGICSQVINIDKFILVTLKYADNRIGRHVLTIHLFPFSWFH